MEQHSKQWRLPMQPYAHVYPAMYVYAHKPPTCPSCALPHLMAATSPVFPHHTHLLHPSTFPPLFPLSFFCHIFFFFFWSLWHVTFYLFVKMFHLNNGEPWGVVGNGRVVVSPPPHCRLHIDKRKYSTCCSVASWRSDLHAFCRDLMETYHLLTRKFWKLSSAYGTIVKLFKSSTDWWRRKEMLLALVPLKTCSMRNSLLG